jgi:hypothetical protein
VISNNKRLSILSDLEAFAFYGPPDFDDEQRSVYFAFEEKEWLLILESRSLHNQVYCADGLYPKVVYGEEVAYLFG